MQNNKIIGGEFNVDIESIQYNYNSILDRVYAYSSGRSALYYILLDIQKRYRISKIYLPDYLCSSVVFAVKKCQMRIIFYNLNKNLEIDINYFPLNKEEEAVILVINYFGLKDMRAQIEFIRAISKKTIIIEDDVQAFYEFHKPEMFADYKFTSLRKTFACPDGGLVKTKNELPIVLESNKFYQYKVAASILRSMQKSGHYDDDVYLHLFEKGESQINDDIDKGISDVSQELISKTYFKKISFIRQCNARQIVKGLKSLNIDIIVPIPESSTPLFVPIWLKDRNYVRKRMFQQRIFCPVHWPLEGMDIRKGKEMAEHEMSIIIDQRYSNMEMNFILETLEKALK